MIEIKEESGGDQPVLDAIRSQTSIVSLTNNEEVRVSVWDLKLIGPDSLFRKRAN